MTGLTQLLRRCTWTDFGCLEWPSVDDDGYGRTSHEGRRWQAHRLAWSIAYGPIPAGAYVCHHCDHRSCVRLEHLYLGDALTNGRDTVERRRHRRVQRQTCARHADRCGRGHPLRGPEADVYVTSWGDVQCRACRRLTARQRRAAARQKLRVG